MNQILKEIVVPKGPRTSLSPYIETPRFQEKNDYELRLPIRVTPETGYTSDLPVSFFRFR